MPDEGGGNVLTRKLGPFPTWVWLLIVSLLIGGWWLVSKFISGRNAGGAPQTSAPETVVNPASPDISVNITEPPDEDDGRKGDHCPAGHHWDDKTRRCVPDKQRRHTPKPRPPAPRTVGPGGGRKPGTNNPAHTTAAGRG